MPYLLKELASDCRSAFNSKTGAVRLEKIKVNICRALQDRKFVHTYLGPNLTKARNILYEDKDYNFCILAHAFNGGANSSPHDHGPTWAIYGQAYGVTQMTDWEVMLRPKKGLPGKVKALRSYELKPGDCRVYPVGAVHSPRRDGDTRLLRVEGFNLAGYRRHQFEVIPD